MFGSVAGAQTYLRADQMREGLRFGSEMTLSSDELLASYPKDGNVVKVQTSYSQEKIRELDVSLRLKYAKAAKPPIFENLNFHSKWPRNAISLEYPDGFKMTVFTDPGVLEMNSSPASQAVIEASLSRIQNDYFDEGSKLGLTPQNFTGSGHIHIEATQLHPQTLRNFLADFFNATGLAAGALNEDVYNSLGPGEMPVQNKRLLREAFAKFDANPAATSRDLVDAVASTYDIPFSQDVADYRKNRKGKRSTKYFAVSLRSFDSLGTIEIRSIRPQGSADSYLKLVTMFTKRMELAEQRRTRGERTPIGEMPSVRGHSQKVLADFDRYLSEVGLKLEDYREFVMPWWQQAEADVDRYLTKARTPITHRSCEGLFRN